MDEISKIEGNGTELISLYIPSKSRISNTRKYLLAELGTVDNIKSAQTKKNVVSALNSLLAFLSNFEESPDNGLVLFFGTTKEGKFVKHVVEPIERVTMNTYICDSHFFVEPLMKMCEDHDTFAIIALDLSETSFGTLKGSSIDHLCTIDSLVPNKHSRGGQSAQRFERLRNDAINEYFKKISDKATELWLNKDIRGIIIGGPGMTKDDFISEEYLHHELRKKIIGTINTAYTGRYGIKEIVDSASDILNNVEYTKEKKVLDEFFMNLSKDTGLSEYGLDKTIEALRCGKVDKLLISDIVDYNTIEFAQKMCDDNGSQLFIISTSNENGKSFSNIKIGAILRYK